MMVDGCGLWLLFVVLDGLGSWWLDGSMGMGERGSRDSGLRYRSGGPSTCSPCSQAPNQGCPSPKQDT